jgi:hypothetical protein
MAAQEKKHGPIVVFLGPTLSPEVARSTLDAIYLPPAVQGSVVSAVQRFEPDAILIIDGIFQSAPAVRHKEILWAISLGIPVVGAASMGALRAAELFPHMLGVGLVYRWYRRFPFAPDDAVAVIHGPPEVNCAALTVAHIDLRMTFRAIRRRGLISDSFKTSLEDAAQRLNFRDRTLERVVAEALLPSDDSSAEELVALLKSELIEQKRLDALQALRLLSCSVPRRPRTIDFALTSAFVDELKHSGVAIVEREL